MKALSDSQARKKSIAAIQRAGVLLVYPINNRPEPDSIWQRIHPNSPMVWEWDDDGDTRVAQLWHIRTELSNSNEVVYSKWYQGRATFFAKDVFVDFLAYLRAHEFPLGPQQQELMEILSADSPQSTKLIKAALALEGKLNEPTFNRLMKPLWSRLLLVGYGEFEDSSFPSLGVGATQTLFEDLWNQAAEEDSEDAGQRLRERLGEDSLFLKWATRLRNENLDKNSRNSYI